ncbi:zinc-dependent metalloprotease [Virgibacillus salarius]|nr:zinc-dependent metalloprotease [Priestia megaterium]
MKRISSIALILILTLLAIPTTGLADQHQHHDQSAATSTYVETLPKAKEFAPEQGPAKIEQSTKVNVLDENGNVKKVKTTKKTTSTNKYKERGELQPQATKTVTVLAVADEEYRAAYSDWQDRVQQIIENTDDAFIRDHGIDFEVQAVASWTSQGGSSEQILADLQRDWSNEPYDFVTGFTKDANFDAGGIAYVYNSAPGTAYSVNLDQGITNTSKAAQHEFSHNYGLGHDPQGSGIRCIMNYDYAYSVDYWHPEHHAQIQNNKQWYGQ